FLRAQREAKRPAIAGRNRREGIQHEGAAGVDQLGRGEVDLPLLAQVANGRRHARPAAQGKDLRSGSVDDQERPLASTGDVDANLVRAGPDQELRVVGAELRRTKADLAPHGFVRLQLQWKLRVKREFEEGEI